MSPKLVTVTFNTQKIDKMIEFYNALGAKLRTSTVAKGGPVSRGVLGSLELVLHSIVMPEENPTPRVSLRFELTDIIQIWESVQGLKDANVMLDLSDMPSGKSFVVIDPDGHSIELFERRPESDDTGE